jgi:hypothetical protein
MIGFTTIIDYLLAPVLVTSIPILCCSMFLPVGPCVALPMVCCLNSAILPPYGCILLSAFRTGYPVYSETIFPCGII